MTRPPLWCLRHSDCWHKHSPKCSSCGAGDCPPLSAAHRHTMLSITHPGAVLARPGVSLAAICVPCAREEIAALWGYWTTGWTLCLTNKGCWGGVRDIPRLLTFWALVLLHGASPHLRGGGTQGHVSGGRLQNPPCSVFIALLEATELPLLGAGPPGPPLTHFTLCCQITREASSDSPFSVLPQDCPEPLHPITLLPCFQLKGYVCFPSSFLGF